MSLNVRVITDKVVWDADTEELILPSSTGQLGILTDHAPCLLRYWCYAFKTGTNWTSIVLMEGFAKSKIIRLQYFAMELKKQILLMQLKHKLIWKKQFY